MQTFRVCREKRERKNYLFSLHTLYFSYILNYHKVLVVEGVGVASGARVSVRPKAHHMLTAWAYITLAPSNVVSFLSFGFALVVAYRKHLRCSKSLFKYGRSNFACTSAG